MTRHFLVNIIFKFLLHALEKNQTPDSPECTYLLNALQPFVHILFLMFINFLHVDIHAYTVEVKKTETIKQMLSILSYHYFNNV